MKWLHEIGPWTIELQIETNRPIISRLDYILIHNSSILVMALDFLSGVGKVQVYQVPDHANYELSDSGLELILVSVELWCTPVPFFFWFPV